MGIQKEIWINSIVGNLFPDNSFVKRAIDHSQFIEGKFVHVPNAGAAPNVEMDRKSLPATITKREDVDLSYMVHEFTSDPVLIRNIEEVELSYDKRESVISEMREKLRETMHDYVIKSWVPEGFAKVFTSGDASASHLDGTTGTRKGITKKDIMKVKMEFDKKNILQEGRCIMLDYMMYNQLVEDLTANEYQAFLASADAQRGTAGKLFGFDIIERSKVLRTVDNASKLTEEFAATDCAAGIAWQDKCVSFARGNDTLFANEDRADYYGTVLSMLCRAGSNYIRKDKAGVALIVQGK